MQAAIDRIKLAHEALQVRAPGEKLYIAYSGGKDSDTVAELALMAVGSDAVEMHYSVTGIDPPEVTRHINQRFKAWRARGIACYSHRPETTMHDLIVKKGLPTRHRRFCCAFLKEGRGDGRLVLTGVRWAESTNRRNSHDVLTVFNKAKGEARHKYSDDNDIQRRIIEHCTTRSRITINPIVDWTDADVWKFIRGNGVSYCPLYDEGFTRLGCIGCPMATTKARQAAFARWPYAKRYYMRAIIQMLVAHPGWVGAKYGWHTAEDVWHWWMKDGHVSGQVEMELDGEDDEP
jgi:phosphoadenosine phosphosulfate reductase